MKNLPTTTSGILDLVQTNARQAGNALEQFASDHGDTAMLEILGEMDILSVAKIVRQYDATIPSIATWLMDAESIVNLLSVEPSHWTHVLSADSGYAVNVQSDAQALLSQIFLSDDNEDKQREILDILISDDFGILYLSIPFLEVELSLLEESDFEPLDNLLEYQSGSVDELLCKIKSLSSEAFLRIKEVLENGKLAGVTSILRENADKAVVGKVSKESEELFTPL